MKSEVWCRTSAISFERTKTVLVFIVLVAIAAGFSLAGLHAAAEDRSCRTASGTVDVSDGVMRIDGKLRDDMVNCVRIALAGTVNRLIVKSTGGFSASAIALGQLVAEMNVPIEVNVICASACAHFLLPAAKIVVLHGNELILFHNTATSMLAAIGDRDWQALADFRVAAEIEASYYAERKIDKRLLTFPHALLNPYCAHEEEGVDDKDHVVIRGASAAVVFRREVLENFGFKFDGSFADTPELVSAAFHNGRVPISPEVAHEIVYASRLPGPSDVVTRVPDCP
jgi:hypothetical protein